MGRWEDGKVGKKVKVRRWEGEKKNQD